MPPRTPLASVKLDARFAAWLRTEAFHLGRTMSEHAEDLVAEGLGGRRPWADRDFTPPPRSARARGQGRYRRR